MTIAIGVDVGGTKCLGVGLVDGKVEVERKCPTPEGLGLLDAVAAMMLELRSDLLVGTITLDSEQVRFGLGIAGLVERDGVLVESPHLTLPANCNVAKLLQQSIGSTVLVENDATAATFAEWQIGAGVGSSNMMLITLGTGIGGGFVLNGQIHRGAHGFAGEVGHIRIDTQGALCKCGQVGCWELLASGGALQSIAQGVGMSGQELVSQARNGDDKALVLIEKFADDIAIGLASLTNTFDPELIVMGGGLSGIFDFLLPKIRNRFSAHVYAADHRQLPNIEPAQLGETAGAVGAALMALAS